MKTLKHFLIPVLLLGWLNIPLRAQQVVQNKDTLNKMQQTIVPLAAFAAEGNIQQLKVALNNGLDAGMSVNEAKEILVHVYAYAGFPRSLNALAALATVLDEREQSGKKVIQGKQSSGSVNKQNKFSIGKEVQTKLTGSAATGATQRFTPIIDTFLKEHLFADIFSRDVLDWKTREIVTLSVLSSLPGAENQLRSHFNVALNTGVTTGQLNHLTSVLQDKVGEQEGITSGFVLQSLLNKTTNTSLPDSLNPGSPTVFPKGTKITNNNFTGTAWLQMLVTNDTTFNTSIGNVTFEPGARTNWHYHPGGQLLLITSGIGLYGEKGKPVKQIRKGDVVKCDPNILHWHGAAPDSEMSHLAVGTNANRAPVVWLEPVTDEEYNSR